MHEGAGWSRSIENRPRLTATVAVRALSLGLVVLAALLLAWRLSRWAYLKTRLPEHAFIAEQRRLASADSPVAADQSSTEKAMALALARAAEARADLPTLYDPSYVELVYPGGDVPIDRGVCTDLVVRAYRDVGIDLQKLVHEDMSRAFDAYPSRSIWGMGEPDPSIDHRRVPNLMVFFRRHGQAVTASSDASGYMAGDIIAWNLGGGLTHIGILTSRQVPGTRRLLVAHHVGGPPRKDDSLFRWEIIGHYRYLGDDGAAPD